MKAAVLERLCMARDGVLETLESANASKLASRQAQSNRKWASAYAEKEWSRWRSVCMKNLGTRRS